MTDAPLQRQLKIGRAVVGLLGLDVALGKVLADEEMDQEAAVDFLYEAIKAANYIPDGMHEEYREALGREYERLKNGSREELGGLTIRILGPGCVSCNNLQKIVIEIVSALGLPADVLQVHDLDEIGRFGILQTPALLINGKLKSSGRLPTRSQIEHWLREAHEP